MTRINTNVSSLNAQKTLAKNQAALNVSMTRLSTGLRINSGSDDPSGMIAAAIQSNDIAAMETAITNTQNGAMLINTADSALGQVTGLLTDIRSLVTQVGNTAVVNSDMIAANQLQVDSALQAIDRISQVTKFQGQSILDGSLDFITTAQTIPQIQNLNVTQANLGVTGTLGVSVEVTAHAEQADITSSSGSKQATARLAFSSRAAVAAGVVISTKSNSSDYDGVQINMVDTGNLTPTTAFYDDATKVLNIGIDLGAANWSDVDTALSTSATTKDIFTIAVDTAGAATTAANITMAQSYIDITAVDKGIDFNNVKVSIAHQNYGAGGAATVSYNEAGKELTITLNDHATSYTSQFDDGATLSSLVTAITGTGYFTAAASGVTNDDRVFGNVSADQRAMANTSATGYLNSAFSASTRAEATLTLAAGANTAVWTGRNITYTYATGTGSMEIKANTPGSQYDGTTVVLAATGALGAVYDATAKTLTITSAAGSTMGQIRNAIANATGAVGAFSATSLSGTADATVISGGSSGMAGGGNMASMGLDIKSTSLGVGDNVKISITTNASINAGSETAVYDALAKTLVVNKSVTSTVAQVAYAINHSKDASGTETGAWKATDTAVTSSKDLNYTNAGTGGVLRISTLQPGGPYANTQIVLATGALSAAYSNGVLTVTTAGTEALSAIIAAVGNATGAVGVFAATDLSGTAPATVTTGISGAGAMTTSSFDVGAYAGSSSDFYTSSDTVTVQALNVGANYNNMQVKFQTVDTLTGALASYNSATNVFTIQVENSEAAGQQVTLQQISDAISSVGGFAGSYSTKNAAGGTNQSSGIVFGKSIDTTAIANTATTGGNTLLGDLTLEVGASQGQQVFTWKAGTSSNQVAAAINAVSDAVGTVAYVNNDLVDFKSAAYGSKSFISLNVINETTTGQFKRAVSSFRENGTDADAKINGITASSDGNQIGINTSSLGMTIDLLPETTGNFNFSITGGGAQFQLGPDVVSNQQLRVGIQSVNTARLGGVAGKLYQLNSGNNASLVNNANLAAQIVDEAGTAVTSLRGRLGAISGLTMLTNESVLTDMVLNAKTSLSLIQDTDFATETANLTRAQILSQANMSVLSIANQQPQQVLSLLPRG